MRKFWGYATNGEFSVGCTGHTVYLFDKNNNEIKKFKDINYAYTPMISPDGRIFVVKSTEGRLAVYSLETFSLVKKFRFSKMDCSQDDGFCFSPDGKSFLNIERHKQSRFAISVYDCSDFSLVERAPLDDEMQVYRIECDEETAVYYVLGTVIDKMRDARQGFVARFEDYQIKNITPISVNEFEFYNSYLDLKQIGFTEKSYEWAYVDCELDELKKMNHTLAKLYSYYKK